MKYLKLYESYSKRSVKDFIKENNIKNDVKKLCCSSNQIKFLNGIENLVELTYLSCSCNKIESLNGIENLIKLKELYCTYNLIKTLKEIENLLNLKHIWVNDNKLKSIDGIENLKNLIDLKCYNNPIEHPTKLPSGKYMDIDTIYTHNMINYFKTYECQKNFLTKFPERVDVLKPYGFNEKIKEEFQDLIEGSEFGFFGLKN